MTCYAIFIPAHRSDFSRFNSLRSAERIRGRLVDWFAVEMKNIHDPRYKKRPNTFKIRGGFLEKISDNKKSELRRELVWKNFWYGTYTKHKIRNVTFRSGSAHPAHFLHPEIFDELDKRVSFSRPVRDYFLKRRATNATP